MELKVTGYVFERNDRGNCNVKINFKDDITKEFLNISFEEAHAIIKILEKDIKAWI